MKKPRRCPPRRRRRTYKRRYTRRKRTMRVKPDGVYKEKVTIKIPLSTQGNNANWAYHNIHWLNTAVPVDLSNTGVNNNNTQFSTVSALFVYYKIYGLSIKFIPYTYGQNASNTLALREAYMGSGLSSNTTHIPETEIRNAPDYTPLNPTLPFKKYIRLSKYIYRQKEGWTKTGENFPTEKQMKTTIQVHGENFGDPPKPIGQIYVTYYVMFKNRKYTT